jgi:hypothetical protein
MLAAPPNRNRVTLTPQTDAEAEADELRRPACIDPSEIRALIGFETGLTRRRRAGVGIRKAEGRSQIMMNGARIIAIATATGAILAANGAIAQASHAPINLGVESFSSFNSGAEQSRWIAQPTEKSLFWDQKGHWGLKLDLSQPVGRDMELRDVQAGAYFRLTPSIRVGGAVALGDSSAVDRTVAPQQQTQTPRVKLETSFKF